MILTGKAAAGELTHARILLKADAGTHGPGWSDTQIAETLEISPGTVARVRKRCVTTSVQEAILPALTSRMRRRRLDGTLEAYLMANELKPWIQHQWCIPTQADAEFVSHMQDVLALYTRPYDAARLQVCMDESNTQLLAGTRASLPMARAPNEKAANHAREPRENTRAADYLRFGPAVPRSVSFGYSLRVPLADCTSVLRAAC